MSSTGLRLMHYNGGFCLKFLLIFVCFIDFIQTDQTDLIDRNDQTDQIDSITELAAFRTRRSQKSKLECLFPTEYAGRCITSPKSGRDICYPELALLDYSCVSKTQNGRRSVPPPKVVHGQYKALITKFEPLHVPSAKKNSSSKPFLVVQYQCNQGYEFLDEAEFLFCRDYQWVQTPPVCVPSEFASEYRKKDNPCQENNGDCSHICRNLGGGLIKCECPVGMILEPDGTCREMDLCLANNGGCSHFCVNSDEPGAMPKCMCPAGFTLRADGKTCIEEASDVSEFLPEKPGLCPQVPFGWPDQKCVGTCRRDQECTGQQKCCNNGCAWVCMVAEPGNVVKPITECTTTVDCRCEVMDEIRQRCTCPHGIVCFLTRTAPDVSISPPGPIEVRPGSPLNLTCHASGFPFPNVTWFKDNVAMAQSNGMHGEKTVQKRLVIKELFKSTVFSCEAVNDVGGNTAEVQVLVTGPGSPPDKITAKVNGTTVTIKWKAPTLPNGHIKGYQVYYVEKDARKPLREWKTAGTVEPRAVIHDLNPETKYFFRIVPYNERGSGIMTNIFSVRTEKHEILPTVTIVEGGSYEVEPGGTVNLTCQVGGYPQPSVAWYQNGNRLQEAAVVSVLKTVYENALETTVFECRASNLKGFANTSIRVEVTGPGSAPGQIQYRVDGVNVEISWGAPEFPNGEIEGYTLYYTTNPHLPIDQWDVELVLKQQTIILRDLKPGTTYFGRIKAFNERGPGPLSETFTVLTGLKNVPPKVRIPGIDGPLRVEVAPGGQVNLTCVASGIPEPSVSWKQEGDVVRSFHQPGPGEKEVSKTIVVEKIVESTSFNCEATNNVGSDSVRVDVAVTGPGSPPENIDVSFEENSILIKWQEPIIPNGHVLGYNIYYTTNRTLPMSSWQKFSVPSSGFQSQAIMHDLQEDTTYHIRIAGYTNLGEGVISQIYQSRTGKKSSPPKVTLQPPDTVITISPGASYMVTCTADGHPDPNLSWYRDGQPVAYRTVLENAKVIAAVLTVESLLKTSVFTCRAINTLGTATKEIIIEVKGPGSSPRSIRYLTYSTNIDLQWEQPEITNGPIIGYEIIYTDEPTDDLNSWFKVNLGVKNQHKLTGLSPSRGYTFRIRAINTKGPGPWSPPFLALTGDKEVKPEVIVLPEGAIYYVSPGGTVNLTCQSEGSPQPDVQWYEHGRLIPHERGTSVTITKENVFESSMFECRATNAVGFARKVVNVEVAGPGEAPLRFEATVKGTTIEASWMPPRITNGNLQSYAVYYTKNPNLDISLWETIRVPTKPPHESPFYDIIISSLPPNTTYFLKVQAISDRGPGVLSPALSVKTSDQGFSLNATVRPEGPIEVPLNGGVELICEATGYPTPVVTWRKGDHPITSAQPNKNTFFIDGVSGKITLECFAENDAGRVVKVAHIFPSEKLEDVCNPKPSFGMDGNYVVKWPDLKGQVQRGSKFIILFTTRGELSLDRWHSIETADPSSVLLPNLQGGQRYFVRMKILSPEDSKSVVCGVFTTVVPTLPKIVVFTRVRNETKLHWGTVHIPDENIEKIFVRYTYEPHVLPYDEWPTVSAEATAREVALPNIRPSTVYTIRLEIVTEKGESFHSVQYEIESPDFDDCEYADCQQICEYDPEENAAVCGCGPGYELNDDKKTCSLTEVTEKNVTGPTRRPYLGCHDNNGGCDQFCEEVQRGIIKCSCTPELELGRDGKSCRLPSSVRPPTARPKIDVCQLPMDPGPCDENNFVWFYDPTMESCIQFTYGGCEGNANRFFSRDQCMDRCSEKPCHQKRKEAILEQLDFLPECDEGGDFVSTQCDVSGECWCVNPEDGMEVAGSRYSEVQGKPYCKSCLFERHRLANKKQRGEGEEDLPQCTDDGLYELVQCHKSISCWCVDQLTGHEILNTRVPATVKISCIKPSPIKPEDVRVVLTPDDNLKFRFVLKPNVTAKKYILYYTAEPEQPTQKWQVIEIEKPFTDDGFERPNFLTPNKTYSFKITPIFEEGLGECSDVVNVDTTLKIPPQPPTIRPENIEPESALIKWDRDPIIDTPDVTHYNVYIAEIETGSKHQIHKVHAWDEILLTLKPGTAYLVYITAVNDFGESPPSNRIDFKTPSIEEFTGKPFKPTTQKIVEETEKVTQVKEVLTTVTPTGVRETTTKKPKVTSKVSPKVTPKATPSKTPTTKKPKVTPKVTTEKEKVTPKPVPDKEQTTKQPKITPKVTTVKKVFTPKITTGMEKVTPKPVPGKEPTTMEPKVTSAVTPEKDILTDKLIPDEESVTSVVTVVPVTHKPTIRPVEVPTKLTADIKTTETLAELATKEIIEKFTATPKKDEEIGVTEDEEQSEEILTPEGKPVSTSKDIDFETTEGPKVPVTEPKVTDEEETTAGESKEKTETIPDEEKTTTKRLITGEVERPTEMKPKATTKMPGIDETREPDKSGEITPDKEKVTEETKSKESDITEQPGISLEEGTSAQATEEKAVTTEAPKIVDTEETEEVVGKTTVRVPTEDEEVTLETAKVTGIGIVPTTEDAGTTKEPEDKTEDEEGTEKPGDEKEIDVSSTKQPKETPKDIATAIQGRSTTLKPEAIVTGKVTAMPQAHISTTDLASEEMSKEETPEKPEIIGTVEPKESLEETESPSMEELVTPKDRVTFEPPLPFKHTTKDQEIDKGLSTLKPDLQKTTVSILPAEDKEEVTGEEKKDETVSLEVVTSQKPEKILEITPKEDKDIYSTPKEDEIEKVTAKPEEDIASPKPETTEEISPEPGREISPKPDEVEDKETSPKPDKSKEISPKPEEKDKELSPKPGKEEEEEEASPKPEDGKDISPKPGKSKEVSLEPEIPDEKDVSPKPEDGIEKQTSLKPEGDEISPKPYESGEASPEPDDEKLVSTEPKKDKDVSKQPIESKEVSLRPDEDEDKDKEETAEPKEDEEVTGKPVDSKEELSPKPEDGQVSLKPDEDKEATVKPGEEEEEEEEPSPKPEKDKTPSPKPGITPSVEKPEVSDQQLTQTPAAIGTTKEDFREEDRKTTKKRTKATGEPKATPIATTVAQYEIITQETAKPTKTLKPDSQIKHEQTLPPVITPEQCDQMDGPMDIVFVLDLSNHIRPQDHKLMVAKITEIIDKTFVVSSDAIRVAFIQYSDTVQVTVRLGDYKTKGELVEAIQSSEHMKGGTVTADALSEANRVLKAGRPQVFQLVVLITDGGSVSDPRQAAKILDDEGIQIIAVGVGPSVDPEEVAQLAGLLHEDKSEFYADSVKTFTEQIAQHVILRICNYIQVFETEKATGTPKPEIDEKTDQPDVKLSTEAAETPSAGVSVVQPSSAKPDVSPTVESEEELETETTPLAEFTKTYAPDTESIEPDLEQKTQSLPSDLKTTQEPVEKLTERTEKFLPGAVTIISAAFVDNKIAIKWDVSEKQTDNWKFIIDYTRISDNNKGKSEVDGDLRETFVSETTCEDYEITIHAVNENGFGVTSAPTLVKCDTAGTSPSAKEPEIVVTQQPDEVLDAKKATTARERVSPKFKPTPGSTEEESEEVTVTAPSGEPKEESEKVTKAAPSEEPKEESEEVTETAPSEKPKEESEKVTKAAPSKEPKEESEEVTETAPSEEPKVESEEATETAPSGEPKVESEEVTETAPSGEPKVESEEATETAPSGEPKVESEEVTETAPSGEPKVESEEVTETAPSEKPEGKEDRISTSGVTKGLQLEELTSTKIAEGLGTSGPSKLLVSTVEPEPVSKPKEEEESDEDESVEESSLSPVQTKVPVGETEEPIEGTPEVREETKEPEKSEEKLFTISTAPEDVAKVTESREHLTPGGEENVTSAEEIETVTGVTTAKHTTESEESSEESSEEITKTTRKGFTASEEEIEGVTGASQPTPTAPSVYEKFTTSIPIQDVVVAPKCNCTCRIIVKTKRGKCYFEDDDGDDELQVIIDDKALQGKDCNDTKTASKSKPRVPYEIDRTPVEVPEDQESDCPCVKPLRGDMCPPGFLLKGGKCRDINECAYKNGGCSHGCVNTVGEYYCACPPGMHRDMTDPKQCLDQDSFYKKLGQLLYHHLWNQAKSNNGGRAATIEPIDDKTLRARYQNHPKNVNRAVARLSNGTNTMKLEWEWQNFLKKFRH